MVLSKKQYAYKHIRSGIADGRYRPGQRITLASVAEEIGVSAVPVREALMQLTHERMVVMKPHVGAVVAIADLPQILDIIDTLAVLEGYATARALVSLDREGLVAELRSINEQMERHRLAGEWQDLTQSNRDFHCAVYAANESATLVDAIDRLWDRLEVLLGASSFSFVPGRSEGSIRDHEAIISMLSDPTTEPGVLEDFARRHKLTTADSLKIQEASRRQGFQHSDGGSH